MFLHLLISEGYPQYKKNERHCSYVRMGCDSLRQNKAGNTYIKRKLLTASISTACLASSFISLNNAWYRQYGKTPFHIFNDAGEWLQMDKMGHAWTAYNSSLLVFKMWQWAGVNRNKAVLLGSVTSLSYLSTIEYLDGRSAAWGWSWSDMGANIIGVSLFALQQFTVNKQVVRVKLTAHSEKYPASMETRAQELFGNSFSSRLLKDYNAQTYWISINLKTFFPQAKLPQWINVALGYGATGLLGGFENRDYDENENLIFDGTYIKRRRQWYVSADVDLSKIKSHNKLIKSILNALNALKIPFPAIEYSGRKLKTHLLYF